MKTQTRRQFALRVIQEERDKQDKKWGPVDSRSHSLDVWLSILMEEVGEFSKASLHVRYGGPRRKFLRKEAVQMAAVAMAIVESLPGWPEVENEEPANERKH